MVVHEIDWQLTQVREQRGRRIYVPNSDISPATTIKWNEMNGERKKANIIQNCDGQNFDCVTQRERERKRVEKNHQNLLDKFWIIFDQLNNIYMICFLW